MTRAEREAILMQKLVDMQVYERALRAQGMRFIGGVDEVGRGPLAGPVVAACVVLPADFDVLGVDDSKKLSEKKREALYSQIIAKALAFGIGSVDNRIIDEINILQATKRAMRQAVTNAEAMLRTAKAAALYAADTAPESPAIDYLLFDAMEIKEIAIPQQSIIKGDAKSLSIAAASIVAKVVRDRLMVEYDEIYPGYGFASNKGYGTKAHYAGICAQGITPIHRRTFLKGIV